MSLETVIGDVTIAPGARIDLSQGVRLGGRSIVGQDAIIEGGWQSVSPLNRGTRLH
jgi:hypothetical protein